MPWVETEDRNSHSLVRKTRGMLKSSIGWLRIRRPMGGEGAALKVWSVQKSSSGSSCRLLSSSGSLSSTDPNPLPAIGLELHVQLACASKLFSLANSPSSASEQDSISNTHVTLFDAATPGTQPILSPDCLRLAIIASLALDCQVSPKTSFDRKHYFYPDLPAGYQITQQYSPIAREGKLLITPEDGADRTFEARITRIQLEQDTAKSFIDPLSPDQILIDLNRSGAALIEIVTGPDFRTAKEASIFVRKLQSILRFAGVTKGNMEQGSLRCDLNVSISLPESSIQGPRCEVKNVNGFGHIERAIDFEILRQKELVESGTQIQTETRGYDISQRKTFRLRKKETHTDYRYLPDSDIPPILIPSSILERFKSLVPELPYDMARRLEKSYGLTRATTEILMMIGFDRIDQLVDVGCGVRYFEAAMGVSNKEVEAQTMANWIIHELLGPLSKSELRFIECPICPEEFGELVQNVSKGLVLRPTAREMLSFAIETPRISIGEQLKKVLPNKPISQSNPRVSKELDVEKLATEIIADMAHEVELIKKGNTKIIGKLIGEGMRRSQQQIDPRLLRKILDQMLVSPYDSSHSDKKM